MARKRNPENKGLPSRWRHTHGAYYYQVPTGLEHMWDGKKQYRLGKSLSQAYKAWALRVERIEKISNIGDMLDRYLIEVVPTYNPKTVVEKTRHIKRLKSVFGNVQIEHLEPRHIYKYVSESAHKVSAHREISTFSHAFTKAVEWGEIKMHPFLGQVRLQGEESRTRYITDEEISKCLALPSKAQHEKGGVRVIHAYIRIKILTGISRKDLLLMTTDQLKDDGIHIQRYKTMKKTGKRTIYAWNDELKAAFNEALELRRVPTSSFVFCTKRGESYFKLETGRADGFASLWKRFIQNCIEQGAIKDGFTEHDLRAKAGSDADSIEHARALLSHSDAKTTQRHYRRRPEVVTPLSRIFNSTNDTQ